VKKKAPRSSRKAAKAVTTKQASEESKKFRRDAELRGEAVPVTKDGSLPAGATHVIVGREPDGTPILERRRFSLK
jgi:hypothetical protein